MRTLISANKMLQPLMPLLNKKDILLASKSPRRREILENTGLKFRVEGSQFEENLDKNSYAAVTDYVKETAWRKTLEVQARISKTWEIIPDIIIGADTVVCMDDVIYEKPRDHLHAIQMLTSFSGRSQHVHSAVCILLKSSDAEFTQTSFVETTEVEFACLNDDVIKAYVDTGEPIDKAGGYGIQGLGGSLIRGIHGDYYNVMGFPLHRFTVELKKLLERNK